MIEPLVGDGQGVVSLALRGLTGGVVLPWLSAAAVLALRDLTLEGGVLQWMVFGVHGQVVLLRRLGEPFGKRPGGQHAVVLEPEIPVEAPCVVLLNHEVLAGGAHSWAATHRLGCPLGIPLGAIAVELPCIAPARGLCRHRVPPYP